MKMRESNKAAINWIPGKMSGSHKSKMRMKSLLILLLRSFLVVGTLAGEAGGVVFCGESLDCRQGICYFYPETCGLSALCEPLPEFPNFKCHSITSDTKVDDCQAHGCGDGTKCHQSGPNILCACRDRVIPFGQPCLPPPTCSKKCHHEGDSLAKCSSDGNGLEFCVCKESGMIMDETTSCLEPFHPDLINSSDSADPIMSSGNENDDPDIVSVTPPKVALVDHDSKERLKAYLAIALSVTFVIACCISILVSRNPRNQSKLKKQRSTLQDIFKHFHHIEDLDIRHSAAGGYHISYLHNLEPEHDMYGEEDYDEYTKYDESKEEEDKERRPLVLELATALSQHV